MDLNHIELPAFIIADLYHSSLVDENKSGEMKSGTAEVIEEEKLPVLEKEPDSPWKSLGGNLKNVLIIINTEEAVHLPDHELTFLTGVLGACKLSLADVAIVNLTNHPEATYRELTTFFKSRIVLLFNVEPATFGLPMNFPHYQIQAFAGNTFLYAPSLRNLENDKVEKSKLWVCLKRLFNL
jgi:hypothetical protein